MSELLAAARAVHLAATMWLFGEAVLACVLADWPGRVGPTRPGEMLRRRLPFVARLSIGIGVGSWMVWLAAEAATMSGMPLWRAIAPATLAIVLGGTLFGKVWTLRLGLAALLLLASWRPGAGGGQRRLVLCTILAGAYLAALAWAGHATETPWRGARLAFDVVHLLAAGAWLGALPALVYLLGAAEPIENTAWATRRFSRVAVAWVSALILSGIGNSWFLVGSIPALLGTLYGRLLLAKLVLLAVMLALAAVNRLVLTPRLAGGDRQAPHRLRRNALLEIAAGLLVVMIVGVLGITIPAAHQSPLWPFAHSLSWTPVRDSISTRLLLAASLLVAAAGAAVIVAGARGRVWGRVAAGLVGIVAAAAVSGWLLAVPAYPTSYAASPVPYTTVVIQAAARLFAQHCTACHGADATGDGPAAASLPTHPPNLVEHAGHHRPGELYWWIAHGRREGMPPFGKVLSSEQVWSVVQFLRALSDSAALAAAHGADAVGRPLAAPDFSFELPERGQQTLLEIGSSRGTLVVLYTFPGSLARLRALAGQRSAFDARRVRIVAVAAAASGAGAAGFPGSASIRATTSSDVAATYAMFAAQHGGVAAAPDAAEFLIDRRGLIRARWIGVSGPNAAQAAAMLDAADRLHGDDEPAPSGGHMH
ncbi:MAG: CopD family protein [Casimicrobiaceae bacterium]